MWLFHSVCFCLTLGVLSCCPRVCLCRPLPERWRCGASPALCDGRRRVWSVRPLRARRRQGPFRLLSFLPLRLLRAAPPPCLRGLPLRPLGRGGPLSPSHCPVPGRSLQQHIHQPDLLSAENLGKTFNLSPSYVGCYFKRNFQETLRQYVTRNRIRMVENLLLNSKMTIKEIAYKMGYTDSCYLVKSFRKTCGMSPLKYRREHSLGASLKQ